jgi:hypothetical protein
MTTQRLFAATMILGLCFGMVHEAHAVGPCKTLCRGKNEPCSLKCYLPGSFVTTCGELVGQCVSVDKQTKVNNKRKSPDHDTKIE